MKARTMDGVSFAPLLTAEKAGRLLGLHPETVRRWAREGKMSHRRLGRRVMFRISDLDDFVERYTIDAVRVAPTDIGEGA